MAKSSSDDKDLRRACEAAIEGMNEKILMSIRVAKSRGIWGKSGKLGRVTWLSPAFSPSPLMVEKLTPFQSGSHSLQNAEEMKKEGKVETLVLSKNRIPLAVYDSLMLETRLESCAHFPVHWTLENKVTVMFVTLDKVAQADPRYTDIMLLENYAAFQIQSIRPGQCRANFSEVLSPSESYEQACTRFISTIIYSFAIELRI